MTDTIVVLTAILVFLTLILVGLVYFILNDRIKTLEVQVKWLMRTRAGRRWTER